MNLRWVIAFAVLLGPPALGAAVAQAQGVEAPAGYVESIEDRPAGAGIAREADAAEAQAERAEAGGAVPGVSRHERATVEEIVVLARKRAEMLEDTPVSVTAVSEGQLREAGITSIDGVQQLVPNLMFTQSFTGVDSEIKIRGVGTSAIDGIFDPGVGIYFDGVFLSRTGFQMFDIVDIEQVEVLRGPQGTLFGKNTIGGAINVSTVKPHDQLEGFAMIRPSNFGTVETRAMLNVPITDWLLSRMAFGSRTTNGYTRNTLIGLPYNDADVLSFLGTLRFLPMDDVTFDVTGVYATNHGHGPAPRCRVAAEQGLGNLVPGYFEACADSEPFEFQGDAQGLQSSTNPGVWGVLNWDFGEVGPLDALAAKAIGSWRRNVASNRFDLDGTQFAVASLAANGGGREQGEPFVLDSEQAELQVNGEAWDNRLVFVAGAFGLWEKQDATTVLSVVPEVLGQVTEQRQEFNNWNWALYTQATAELTDWLSLTGGIRYTEEKKGASATTVELGDPTMPTTFAQNSAIFTAWTPMGSVALRAPDGLLDAMQVFDHVMAYGSYSRGFKGGGFNLAVGAPTDRLDPFDPETLDSFEVGLKTISFDQRLTFNLAAFLGKYDDIQVTTIRVESGGDPNNPVFERLTLNAAKATTKGFELEAMALPVAGLQLRGSVGLTDATYDDFTGPSSFGDEPVDRAGQTFNGVPKWQTHLAVQYSLPVELADSDWLTGWVTPRVEWYYQSAVHWDFVELEQATQRGYNLLHARLSYDFLDDRAQVALWAKNLIDEDYFSSTLSIVNVAGTLTNFYSPPRTFGGELSYRF